jgi:hypothetical protein
VSIRQHGKASATVAVASHVQTAAMTITKAMTFVL